LLKKLTDTNDDDDNEYNKKGDKEKIMARYIDNT
jgi:hypothetical protein